MDKQGSRNQVFGVGLRYAGGELLRPYGIINRYVQIIPVIIFRRQHKFGLNLIIYVFIIVVFN